MTAPGILFATLWDRLASKAGAILAVPWDGRGAQEFEDIRILFETEQGPDVPSEVAAYLAGGAVSFKCGVIDLDERAFVVMCALDEAAIAIHPAFPTRVPGVARVRGGMLNAMRTARTSDGCYADVGGIGLVVPKGHLMPRRRPNDRDDASGADLSNQFEHLTLLRHLQDGRKLTFVAPPPSKFDLPPDRAERVGLAPIAEDHDDLVFTTSKRGARAYIDTQPGAVDLSGRISANVTGLLDEGVGLVVLPELVMPHKGVTALVAALKSRANTSTPALIVAGTGVSDDNEPTTARPHNEAVLVTSAGRILGRQRKLHQFNMAPGRMRECGIDCAPGCDDDFHLEDSAAGSELVIYDLLGLGRVMLLICEDLQQQTPGGDVALIARPDWILTPILDVSLAAGRWPHTRSIEIGRKTFSRVVVSCSSTLSVRAAAISASSTTTTINTGICYDGFVENRMKLVERPNSGTASWTVVEWNAATWPRHWIEMKP